MTEDWSLYLLLAREFLADAERYAALQQWSAALASQDDAVTACLRLGEALRGPLFQEYTRVGIPAWPFLGDST